MHEIVTLQFGQQSNYLGTHYWNTQESYFTYPPEPESPVNHDISFRPGIAPDGSDTFTPRTLIYDLKGAFGSMKKINALYEPEDDGLEGSGVWASKPIVQRSQPIQPSPYQASLDAGTEPSRLTTSTVRYWSDYSRVYYHPKSLVQLSEFDVNDKLMPFEKWDVGLELFEKLEREVDLVDRDLRPFVEECDGLQGLQIVTGIDDAWGGWASGWLERLRDEYGKLSIWTWGLGDQGGNMTTPRERRIEQIANSARSTQVLAEQSSVFAPLSNNLAKMPPYAAMGVDQAWHIGAMQALAVESMTLPSRMRSCVSTSGMLRDMEEIIDGTGKRRIAKLEMSVADPESLEDEAEAGKGGPVTSKQTDDDDGQLAKFDIDFFAKDYRAASRKARARDHVFGRVEASRGEWKVSESDMGIAARDRFSEGPALQRFSTRLLFPKLDSYPSIFDLGSGQAKKLAVHTGLTTSTGVADQVRQMEQIVRRIISVDEREALSNGLQSMAEEYDEGWSSGSDSDDD